MLIETKIDAIALVERCVPSAELGEIIDALKLDNISYFLFASPDGIQIPAAFQFVSREIKPKLIELKQNNHTLEVGPAEVAWVIRTTNSAYAVFDSGVVATYYDN
jgi:hypothetical protein